MIDEEIYRLQEDYIYNTKNIKAIIKAGTLVVYKYNRETEERTITLEDGTVIIVDDSILSYVKDSNESFNDLRESYNTEITKLNIKNETLIGLSLISFFITFIFGIIAAGAELSYKSYTNTPHYNVVDNMGNTYVDESPIESPVTINTFTIDSNTGITYTYSLIPIEELELPVSYYISLVSSILFICTLALTILLWLISTFIDKKIHKKTTLKYNKIFDYVTLKRGN